MKSSMIKRARGRLGERRYNVFTSNCEHFATWCKTGYDSSGQVVSFLKRVGTMTANVITGLPKGLLKQLMFVLKQITTESIDDVFINGGKVAIGESVDDVLVKLGSVNAVVDITKKFKLGVTAASVLLSLVIEFVFFWFNYRKA